eukprot:Nk52_evm1s320 gene=Nk52_evmTU1s320
MKSYFCSWKIVCIIVGLVVAQYDLGFCVEGRSIDEVLYVDFSQTVSVEIDTAHWMTRLYNDGRLSNVHVGQAGKTTLILPGAHNAASNGLKRDEFIPDQIENQEESVANAIPEVYFGNSGVPSWNNATEEVRNRNIDFFKDQSMSVTELLNAGVRMFHFKLCFIPNQIPKKSKEGPGRPIDGEYFHCHINVGSGLKDIAREVKIWSDAHPSELVWVEYTQLHVAESVPMEPSISADVLVEQMYEELYKIYSGMEENRIISRDVVWQPLSWLFDAKKSLMVVNGIHSPAVDGFFDEIVSVFEGSQRTNESFVLNRMQWNPDEKDEVFALAILYPEMPQNRTEIVSKGFSRELKKYLEKFLETSKAWNNGNFRLGAVSTDFAHRKEFVWLLLKLNHMILKKQN